MILVDLEGVGRKCPLCNIIYLIFLGIIKTGTGLSKYVWQLKDNKPHPIPYEIEWEILAKEKPYNPVTGVCRLCLLEAHYLMFDKVNTTLNTKDEYFSVCPHKRNYLLY